MKKQTFLILTPENRYELTHYLNEGWAVVNTCPMPSTSSFIGNDQKPTCLVVLEKDK